MAQPNPDEPRCIICGEVVEHEGLDAFEYPEYLDAIGFTVIGAGESIYEDTCFHIVMHDDCLTDRLKQGLIEEIT